MQSLSLSIEMSLNYFDFNSFTGEITFVPITSTSPASQYWGIDQTITYGSSGTALLTSSGIVDTGTTLLLIATDAFNTYQTDTGATLDQFVLNFRRQFLYFNVPLELRVS